MEGGQSLEMGLACEVQGRSLMSLQKYTFKDKDPAQETVAVYKANYPAANGVFHVVTTLRWQPPSELPEDSTVSQCSPCPEPWASG